LTTNISARHGYGVHGVINLCALVEADSTRLMAHHGEADETNEEAQRRALDWAVRQRADIVIAWGACRHLEAAAARMLNRLSRRRRSNVYCLGMTRSGAPRFPRGISRGVALVPYEASGSSG
jgi:hypothetical protein